MTIKKCTQTFALVLMAFTFAWNASANSTTASTTAPEIYKQGLISTVYIEDAQDGTWASSKPVGIPVGEFVDKKIPVFSFANLQQDATAWAMYSGSHIGIEWTGYFYAEEAGDYVFMLDMATQKNGYQIAFAANSGVANLSLSGKTIIKNEFKLKNEKQGLDSEYRSNKVTSIRLEAGYYPLKFWLHCGVMEGAWRSWTTHAENAKWTLKVKRPSDRMLKNVPKGVLVWQ